MHTIVVSREGWNGVESTSPHTRFSDLTMHHSNASHHRLIRRLHQHFGREIRIMVGLWTASHSAGVPQELLDATSADLLVTSLRQAVRQIQESFEPGKLAAPLSAA